MGCGDSKVEPEEEDILLPPTDPKTEAKNPVVFTHNVEPTPPKKPRRGLFSSFQDFQEIDDHAARVPSSMRLTPPTLVNYLVEPCQRDIDVVRVFYYWICTNIRYDVDCYYGKRPARNDPQSVLNSKMAVCQGYSELFALFCRMVKIPVKVIEGHSKGFAYNPNRPITRETITNHAWNAVYVQGDWRFIEATWGAGTMNEDGKWEKGYTDRHFMMDPDKMINSHFPLFQTDDEDMFEKSAPWQLLKEPLTLEEFDRRVKLYDAAQDWDLDLFPHKTVQLETGDKLELMLRTKRVPLTDVGVKMYDREGNAHNAYLMVQRLPDNVFKVIVRPPQSTKYKFTVFGKVSDSSTESYSTLVDYIVEGVDIPESVDPYPEQFGAWGVDDPTQFGIDASMKCRTVFVCESGRMSLPIKTIGDNRYTHKLFHAEKAIEDAEDFVIREFQRNLMVLHMRFPFTGFYTLKLYTKSNSSQQKMFNHATNLLVECKQSADIGPFPKTFAETDRHECILLEPGEKDVPANAKVTFAIESSVLQCAMVKSSEGSTKMQLNNNEWTITVTTPGPGEKIGIYGSEIPNKYLALYQFRSEKDPPPSTRANIETPNSRTETSNSSLGMARPRVDTAMSRYETPNSRQDTLDNNIQYRNIANKDLTI